MSAPSQVAGWIMAGGASSRMGRSKALLEIAAEPMIVCLDDWKLNDLDIRGLGEYKAFNEFLEGNSHLIAKEIKSYNRKSKSYLIQPRR